MLLITDGEDEGEGGIYCFEAGVSTKLQRRAWFVVGLRQMFVEDENKKRKDLRFENNNLESRELNSRIIFMPYKCKLSFLGKWHLIVTLTQQLRKGAVI